MNRSRAADPSNTSDRGFADDPHHRPAALFRADDGDAVTGLAGQDLGLDLPGGPALDPVPVLLLRALAERSSEPQTISDGVASAANAAPRELPGAAATMGTGADKPIPAQLGSVAVFASNTSGAWDDGQASQPGTENYFSGSNAYAEQNGPSFRIAFASFDAVTIQHLVTDEMQAGDVVSVDISYTISNSAGVVHTATLQQSDFALGPQEWIEKDPAYSNSTPDDPNGYLNPAQDSLNVPNGYKTVLASNSYSFSSGTGSISINTDVTSAVQQAAAAGRDLVLGLSITTIDDPYDDVPQDFLVNPRITVTAIPTGPKPTISNTLADQHLQAGASDRPFASVVLGDPSGGSSDTLGIAILDASGQGTDANGTLVATAGGILQYDGPGQYSLGSAGSLAALQSELEGLRFTAAATAAGQTATFELDLQSTDGSTTDNQNTSVIIDEACFASGTLIATPDGERRVEEIQPGDLVDTADGPRAAVWCGHRAVDVSRLADPTDHWLVRIRAGAFTDAAPWRDLWVTQEHGILVDGGLIPARMLVNGGSIALDRSRTRYSYHHLELERHGILFAEGLPTESYLDTGNRSAFANANTPALPPGLTFDAAHERWATDAAAPLLTDRTRVEAVWRRLVDRARARGWMYGVEGTTARTADPAMQLELADGTVLPVATWNGTVATFHLPAGVRPVRLLSRSARPSEAVGPFLDDRRRLGVAVECLVLREDDRTEVVVLPAAALDGPGWHGLENGTRWTDGAATLALPKFTNPATLELHIVATLSYVAGELAATLNEAA